MKTGRKTKPYETTDGKFIDGLYRKPGTNIWRITAATPRIDFRADDEHIAIARYAQWQLKKQRTTFALPSSDISFSIHDAMPQAMYQMEKNGDLVRSRMANGEIAGQAAVDELLLGMVPYYKAMAEGSQTTVNLKETILWNWVRQQYLKDPKRVGNLIGMPSQKSIAIITIVNDYLEHHKIIRSTEVKTTMQSFASIVGTTLDNITAHGV